MKNAGTAQGYLVRQSSIRPNGTWDTGSPVAGPITSFQVGTLHQGDTNWTRGIGVTESMLQRTSPNRIQRTTPTAIASSGYKDVKGFYTVGAVRIRYTAPRTYSNGTIEEVRRWVVANTTPGLTGGADADL